jgi:hypothetical protein
MWSKAEFGQFGRQAAHYTQKGIYAVGQGIELAGMLKGAYQVGSGLVRAGATILPLIV